MYLNKALLTFICKLTDSNQFLLQSIIINYLTKNDLILL